MDEKDAQRKILGVYHYELGILACPVIGEEMYDTK
jgi:hypothetical protein